MPCLVMCYKDKEKTQIERAPEYYSSGFSGNPPETFPSMQAAVSFIRAKGCRFSNGGDLIAPKLSRTNGHFYEIDARFEPEDAR